MATVRTAGVLVLAVQLGLAAYRTPTGSAWLPALAAAGVLAATAVSAVALSDVSRARVKQLLDAVEVVVVVTMVPLLAGALGLYRLAGAAGG